MHQMDETGKKWHSEAFSLLSIILKRMYTFHMCVLHYKSYKETLQKQNISVLFLCIAIIFTSQISVHDFKHVRSLYKSTHLSNVRNQKA